MKTLILGGVRSGKSRLAEQMARTSEQAVTYIATARAGDDDRCLLVDCLTLWLTQLMAEEDTVLEQERSALLDVVPSLPGEIILVSNETNLGVMPMGAFSRRYCDEAGRLHQDLAQRCDRVILTIAGLPHLLKGALKGVAR